MESPSNQRNKIVYTQAKSLKSLKIVLEIRRPTLPAIYVMKTFKLLILKYIREGSLSIEMIVLVYFSGSSILNYDFIAGYLIFSINHYKKIK